GLGKYVSAPRMEQVHRVSDRDLRIEVFQSYYALPHWRVPALRERWARDINAQLREAIDGRSYCLWLNCPGVLSNALARELSPGAAITIFDSSDDFKARPGNSLAPYVDELASLATKVVCVNQPTAEHIQHPAKIVFRNCTSWAAFQNRKEPFRLSPHFPKPAG